MKEQLYNAHAIERQAKDRQLKVALSVHVLPEHWTANTIV